MALENYTTYTETDPNARITVTATRVSWAGLRNGDGLTYVYRDKGVDYFAGNFEIDITFQASAADNGVATPIFGLANVVNTFMGIAAANESGLFVQISKSAGQNPYFTIRELDSGTDYLSPAVPTDFFSLSTIYYLTVRRDETVGTYGTFYLDVYTDVARTTLDHSLSLALHTSSKDYRYIYAVLAYTTSAATLASTGYTEAMEITSLATTPAVTTQACTAITTTTATGNGTITSLGNSSVTQHGHCWVLNDGASPPTPPTTADSKTTNGAGVLGAFTSSITGLTPGLPYVVRAYVTNSAGTSYGAAVYFRAGLPQTQKPPLVIGIQDNEVRFIGEDGVEYKLTGTAV